MFPSVATTTAVAGAGTVGAGFASMVGVVLAVILAFAALRLGVRALKKGAR